jgi:hypothetical protein
VSCFSQTYRKVRKVVNLMSQQDFYLNGGIRAQFGGKSRVYYRIDLPENTVSWYYVFTTHSGQSPAPIINLLTQITSLFDPSGLAPIVASAILAPTGSHACDMYLMDYSNKNAFMNKVDQNHGSFSYYESGSRMNYKSGTIMINDKELNSGSWYIGFRNPSAIEGLNVSFEAVAITEELVMQ